MSSTSPEQVFTIFLFLIGFLIPTLVYIWAVKYHIPVYLSRHFYSDQYKTRDGIIKHPPSTTTIKHDPNIKPTRRVKKTLFKKNSHSHLVGKHTTTGLDTISHDAMRSSQNYSRGNPINTTRFWMSTTTHHPTRSSNSGNGLRTMATPFANTGPMKPFNEDTHSSAGNSQTHLPLSSQQGQVIQVKSAFESYPLLSQYHFDAFQPNHRPMTDSSGTSLLAGNLVSAGPGFQPKDRLYSMPFPPLFASESHHSLPFGTNAFSSMKPSGPASRLPYCYSVASTTTSSITRLFHEAPLALLSFSDIKYSATSPSSKLWNSKSNKKTWILKGVSGYMKAGTLTAIMGPSGCGKTTLLDILAGRKYTGDITGSIHINGFKRNDATFKRISAYVEQDDALFSFLTVKEILLYASELRIPQSISAEEKMAKVNKVMDDLDLLPIADKRIGDERSGGLSRGQRRRVTVAIELITSPSIIFLDEPTSGLDAYSSLKLMKLLKKLAHRGGRTIICTIHQPRSDIFSMFDSIYMMVRGQIAYFGPLTGIADYFKHIGSPIPVHMNPADFIVDLTHDHDSNDAFGFVDGRYDPLAAGDSMVGQVDIEHQAYRDDWVAFENQFYKDKKKRIPIKESLKKPNVKKDTQKTVKPKLNDKKSGDFKKSKPAARNPQEAVIVSNRPNTIQNAFKEKWQSFSSSMSHLFGNSIKIETMQESNHSHVPSQTTLFSWSGAFHKEEEEESIKGEIKLPPIDNRFKSVVAASQRKRAQDTDPIHEDIKDPDPDTTEPSSADYLPLKYSSSNLCKENVRELESIVKGTHPSLIASRNESSLYLNELKASYAVGYMKQVSLILSRSHINNMRNGGFFVSWIVGGVSFLFYGLIYLGLRTSNLVDQVKNGIVEPGDTISLDYWDSQRAFIFQIVTAIVFLQLETLTSAHLEKRLFYREFASGAYSPFAYHSAWTLRTCCYGLLRSLLFPPLVYFMSGLTITFEKYFIFCIVFALMDTIGSALSLLLVCAVPTLEASSSAFTSTTSFIATGCGFFLRPSLIPVWFHWAYFISWYKYALDALYLNEFQHTQDPGTGLAVIEAIFEVDSRFNVWTNILVLFLYPILFHGLSWFASWHRTRPRKNKQ